jgi:hypothetical protein
MVTTFIEGYNPFVLIYIKNVFSNDICPCLTDSASRCVLLSLLRTWLLHESSRSLGLWIAFTAINCLINNFFIHDKVVVVVSARYVEVKAEERLRLEDVLAHVPPNHTWPNMCLFSHHIYIGEIPN